MTTHLPRLLLCFAILAAAATTSGQTLQIEPIELRPNLLPDGSFETASDQPSPPWQWHQGKTDATSRIDASEAHSGKNSLRLTNSTAMAPHVFGMLSLSGELAVKPDTTYTFSCYVKGTRVGYGFFGGGKDWRIRGRFPERTGGKWLRVVTSFTTGADETRIPVILAIESPTDPFWVDDLQLVEGGEPMPVFDPTRLGAAAIEIAFSPPVLARRGDRDIVCEWNAIDYPRDRYLFASGDVSAEGYLRVPDDLAESTLAFRLIGADGKTLAEKSQPGAIKTGTYRLTLSSPTGDPQGADVRLLVALDGKTADGKSVHAESDLRRRLVTPAEVEAAIARAEALRAKLAEHVATLEREGRDAAYPRVALTILENFVGYAREDVAHGELARARDAAVQMEAVARAAIERTYLPAVPRYVTGPGCPGYRLDGPAQLGTVRWPDGRIENERPIQFLGLGHFGQVVRDIEKANGYGCNIIQIEFGPRSVLVAEDKVSTEPIDHFLAVCDRAAKANVAVNLLVSPHYFPDWAFEKWPHLRDGGGGFLKVDVQAPEARQVYEKFLRATIPRIKDHPALHSICLSNEPVYTEGHKSQVVRLMWHEWLQKRHGTVDALNQRWGSDYADFASIPPVSPDEFTPSPIAHDFVLFNREAFAEFHAWMAGVIREMAPKLPLHAKIMICPNFGRHSHGPWSVSPERFAQFSDFNGNDAWKNYTGRGPWASQWQDETMGYDFQRSMADRPVFNSENHLIPDRNFEAVPPEHIANVYWQGAIHGQSATTTWVWERTYSCTDDTSGSIMHRPACVEAMGRTGLDLMRLAPEVTALQRMPIEAVLVWSPASIVAGQEYLNATRLAYEALAFQGIRLGFVTERQLARAAETGVLPAPLDKVKTIIAAGAIRTPETTVSALAKFCERGGKVLCLGECFTQDEYGKKREKKPGEWLPLPATSREAFDLVGKFLAEVPLERPARLETPDGKPVWGVEYLAVRHQGRLLVNMANYLNEPRRVRVVVDGKAVGGADLLSGRTLGKSYDLPPMQPVLLDTK